MRDETLPNNYFIKLTGKGSISEPLEIGYNYKIYSEGAIISKNESDNNNGSSTFTYKYAPVIIEIQEEKGPRIKAKDTRRASQKLRAVLYKKWENEADAGEFDDYYEFEMAKIIKSLMDVD